MVEVRSASRAADAAPQPEDRRGRRSPTSPGRRRRSGSTRPGSPSGCDRGHAAAAARQARPRAAFASRGHEIARRRDGAAAGIHTTGIVPVHPATERLRAAADSRVGLAGAAARAPTRSSRCRPSCARAAALAGVGRRARPRPTSRSDRARPRRRAQRLAFEELFLHQAALAARRGRRRVEPAGDRASAPPGELVGRWLESLPFELDRRPAARRSTRSTPTSTRGEPMQRLLMGEVGSGKTVVALYAMLRALEAGYQAALMAPTETLAEQHAATLDRAARRRGDPVRAADRRDARPRAGARRWSGSPPGELGAGRRHPRPDRARRRVRPPRASASSTSSTASASRQRRRSTRRGPEGSARRTSST